MPTGDPPGPGYVYYDGNRFGYSDVARHIEDTNRHFRAEIDRLNDVVEQQRTQLAGVSVVALGGTCEAVRATKGMYGWTPTYDDVLALRVKYDELLLVVKALCPHILDVLGDKT